MVASLERLAMQYQIPFRREVASAGFAQKAGAFAGGLVDAVALDFIPDDWYSSESTRSAKNWGKGIGTVGTIAATLGGAALARGGVALGTKAAGALSAKQVARQAARNAKIRMQPGKQAVPFPGKTPGNAAQRRTAKRAHERVPEHKGTPDAPYNRISDGPGKAGKAFDNLSPENIEKIAKNIGKGAGSVGSAAGYTAPGALAKFSIASVKKGLREVGTARGWKWAEKSVVDDALAAVKSNPADISGIIGNAKLSTDNITKITKAITAQHGKKKLGNTLIAQVKGAGTTFNAAPADILKFVDNIGGIKKVTTANIAKIGKKAKLSSTEIAEITKRLTDNKLIGKPIDDVASFLVQATKTEKFNPASLLNTDLGLGLAAGVAATSPVTGLNPFGEGLTPSREQLEASQDPYDPMNQ